MRTCAGCRQRAAQAVLVRFVRRGEGWERDVARTRAPGRGAYLCSAACAARVAKNKRYAGLAGAAQDAAWESLCEPLAARV